MGFRFQKRIKLIPGVTLNLSKAGLSTSFGVRGARLTLGHGKTRKTIGLPGTGLSYSSVNSTDAPQDRHSTVDDPSAHDIALGVAIAAALLIAAIWVFG